MKRAFLVPMLALAFFLTAEGFDDGPPISITSPDRAVTFSMASIQQHALLWDAKHRQLLAHIVFVPIDGEGGAANNEDAHDFRLPGVTFDEKKGLFFATSAQGAVIPVARIKKTLFLKTIEPLPNTNVRVEHPRGEVSVVLEAIDPNGPAMRAATAAPTDADAGSETNTDPEGNHLHSIDLQNVLH